MALLITLAVFTPAAFLVALLAWPKGALFVMLFCAATLPFGLFLVDIPQDTERVLVRYPGELWSRAECRGHSGVEQLFMDKRRGNPVRWWVKCRDGSKSGLVTNNPQPQPFVESGHRIYEIV